MVIIGLLATVRRACVGGTVDVGIEQVGEMGISTALAGACASNSFQLWGPFYSGIDTAGRRVIGAAVDEIDAKDTSSFASACGEFFNGYILQC